MRRHTPFLATVGSTLLLMPSLAFAACPVFLLGGTGAAGLAGYINNFLLGNGATILGGVAAGFLFYYGFKMVVNEGDESTITTTRKSFIYALIGFGVLAAGDQIRAALCLGSPGTSSPQPFETGPLIFQLHQLRGYLVEASEGILLLMLVIAAYRFITSGGDESAAANARKNILHYAAAIMIMMTSTVIVQAVFFPDTGWIGLVIEIAGVIRFALAFMGALSVVALFAAGVMLIISIDESLKDRARQTVIGTLASLLIALFSYAILTAVINTLQIP